MLNVYIYDREDVHRKNLEQICFKYFFRQNYEAEIKESSEDINQLKDSIEFSDILSLFMLENTKESDEFARDIRVNNVLNYIVMIIANMGELLQCMNPYIRPSGFILKPAKKEDVEQMLLEIWKDYSNISKCSEVFSFKLKARSYSIAYDKILFFESGNKKITIRTEAQEFEFYDSLDNIIQNTPNYFFRVHKSFLINLNMIKMADFGKMIIQFIDDSFVLLSRSYKLALQEIMEKRKG